MSKYDEMLDKCLCCEPTTEENMAYAMSLIESSQSIRESLILLGPANPERLEASRRVWDLFFPDHCPGGTVFFAAAREVFSLRHGLVWLPAVLISCRHFEHGDTKNELMLLEIMAMIVSMEALGGYHDYWYYIYQLNPAAEVIVMTVTRDPDTVEGYNSAKEAVMKAVKLLLKREPLEHVHSTIGEFLEVAANG